MNRFSPCILYCFCLSQTTLCNIVTLEISSLPQSRISSTLFLSFNFAQRAGMKEKIWINDWVKWNYRVLLIFFRFKLLPRLFLSLHFLYDSLSFAVSPLTHSKHRTKFFSIFFFEFHPLNCIDAHAARVHTTTSTSHRNFMICFTLTQSQAKKFVSFSVFPSSPTICISIHSSSSIVMIFNWICVYGNDMAFWIGVNRTAVIMDRRRNEETPAKERKNINLFVCRQMSSFRQWGNIAFHVHVVFMNKIWFAVCARIFRIGKIVKLSSKMYPKITHSIII